MIDYKNSIVLIGSVGAGKSLVSRALAAKLGLQVITTDEFRHLPKMDEILKTLSDPYLPPRIKDEYIRYQHLRSKYPSIRNYSDFGFNPESSKYLERNFGKIAWHYYQKQFENLLIQDICANIQGAVILDTGGGMPISLDQEYAELRNKFENINSSLFHREFKHIDMISKAITSDIYSKFEHIVYLKMPDSIIDRSDRAQDDYIGKKFIESGDYDKIATDVVDTTGLYVDGKPQHNVLDTITNNIIDIASNSIDIMEE